MALGDTMETRAFGNTGLRVSVLGFGAGHVGGDDLSEGEASRLLNEVLDLGVTLIDTARSYGLSEERVGRHLAHRRDAFVERQNRVPIHRGSVGACHGSLERCDVFPRYRLRPTERLL